jgi:hypothetical protein
VEPDVNSPYIHTGTRVDQMYGVGADAAPIDLRGWSRWPEILWRRASTRGLLADQLRTRDAAATIYAAGAVSAHDVRDGGVSRSRRLDGLWSGLFRPIPPRKRLFRPTLLSAHLPQRGRSRGSRGRRGGQRQPRPGGIP